MRIALVTDAWRPQVNGVVRTLSAVVRELTALGHRVEVIAPDGFRTMPCPTYPEIRLALWPGRDVRRRLQAFAPEAIHIATEGPLGWAARHFCLREGLAFTTSFHTRFPEYVAVRTGLPTRAGYAALRRFHAPAERVMAATTRLAGELAGRGFPNVVPWSRGVDTELFPPRPKDAFAHLDRPVFVYVGRVAVEKNIAAFLDLDLPGSKLVIGDGPLRRRLQAAYSRVTFTGALRGEALACGFAAGDVFVFPSRTDTFGLVMLEALACGVPVAAYPEPGPLDVIGDTGAGILDEDLRAAALSALDIPPARCRALAVRHSWGACAAQFTRNLARIDTLERAVASAK